MVRALLVGAFVALAAAAPRRLAAEPELPPELLEPNATADRVVTTTTELVEAMKQPAMSISLKLDGTFDLSSLVNASATEESLLPIISAGKHITLWSDTGAVLNAGGEGRIFTVQSGGMLLLQAVHLMSGKTELGGGGCVLVQDDPFDIQEGTSWFVVRHGRFSNCTVAATDAAVNAEGGAVDVAGGTVVMTGATAFEHCHVSNTAGDARGGGLGMSAGSVTLKGTTFYATEATSTASLPTDGAAFGGGVSLAGFDTAELIMEDVEFSNTRATSSSTTTASYGGALGLTGGRAQIYTTKFLDTTVFSSGQAVGGGLGMSAGTVFVTDSLFVDNSANSARNDAAGGGIANLGGTLNLYNVTMTNPATTASTAQAIISYPAETRAAILKVTRAPCSAGDAPMIATPPPGGALQLRNLTVDAPGCDVLYDSDQGTTSIYNCSAAEVCGTNAVCELSDATVPTPLCTCPATMVSADGARSDFLAPYSVGCMMAPATGDTYEYTTSGAVLMIIATIATLCGMGVMIYLHNKEK